MYATRSPKRELLTSQQGLVLILSQHNTVKVAADKVAEDDAAVDAEDFPEMELPE